MARRRRRRALLSGSKGLERFLRFEGLELDGVLMMESVIEVRGDLDALERSRL